MSKKHEMPKLTFGIDTFGDIPRDSSGKLVSHAAAIRQVIDEAVLADQLGIDVIGLGEHHRSDYAISSPDMVLAAIAGKTKQIKLSSAVTVLSSDDPVRVWQRFATLDAVSKGRAQIILGRGSFTESFPLFGYDLQDYEALFNEKLDLFHKLLDEKPVSWPGGFRPALEDAELYPKTESGRLETFIGVGGSPKSVMRAAFYDLPIIFAIIGGDPVRFKPYLDLYNEAVEEYGTTRHPTSFHSPGFIADSDETAIEIAFKPYKAAMDRIGKDRGWPPLGYGQFKREIEQGSLYVGSPETVAKKIAHNMKVLGATRFDLVYGHGDLPTDARLHMIELFGSKVIPQVKELMSEES